MKYLPGKLYRVQKVVSGPKDVFDGPTYFRLIWYYRYESPVKYHARSAMQGEIIMFIDKNEYGHYNFLGQDGKKICVTRETCTLVEPEAYLNYFLERIL